MTFDVDIDSLANAVVDATPPTTVKDLKHEIRDTLGAAPSLRGEITRLCNHSGYTNADRVHYIAEAVREHNPELAALISQRTVTPNKMVTLVRKELDKNYLQPLGMHLVRGRIEPLQVTDQSDQSED